MSDIIERIKGLRYVHVPQASQLFEEAIAEIARLRLTDAEREAVWAAWCDYADAARMHHRPTRQEIAAALGGLLDRIGHQEGRPES